MTTTTTRSDDVTMKAGFRVEFFENELETARRNRNATTDARARGRARR